MAFSSLCGNKRHSHLKTHVCIYHTYEPTQTHTHTYTPISPPSPPPAAPNNNNNDNNRIETPKQKRLCIFIRKIGCVSSSKELAGP